MKPSLVIIGLGNPGKTYEKTRHNAGFQAIDCLSHEWSEGEWTEKQKFTSLTQDARMVTFPVLLVKPQTYMNRSGEAVKKIIDFYKLDPSQQILVVCDDIDLPLGTVRLRRKGGPGTHNGLRSIVTIIGEDFPRLRIGLGPAPKGDELATWVLNVPPADEQEKLKKVYEDIPEMVKKFVMETPAV